MMAVEGGKPAVCRILKIHCGLDCLQICLVLLVLVLVLGDKYMLKTL